MKDEGTNPPQKRSIGGKGALGTGVLLTLGGAVMLFTPGPGLVTLGAGLVLMGRALGWRWTARLSRRIEDWVEKRRASSDTPDHDVDSGPGRPQ